MVEFFRGGFCDGKEVCLCVVPYPNIVKPLVHGWMLKIETADEYRQFVDPSWFARDIFLSVTDEKSKPTWASSLKNHPASLVGLIGKLDEKRTNAILSSLPIYMNMNGGWMTCDGCFEVESTVSKSWPGELNPRFLKWEFGSHWYVKLGCMDIEIDGNFKWDTIEEAKSAFERWRG